MRAVVSWLTVLLATGLLSTGQVQSDDTAGASELAAGLPVYRVSFERREAVSGVSASYAIRMPWQCTTDGTIFVSFVSTVPTDSGLPPPPPGPPPMLLASISPAGRGRMFRLD